MILGGRSLTDLSINDFQSLIDNRVPESPQLDYKSTAYSGRPQDIREMLRDVTSLANAEGGYLVLGIREDSYGRAEAFTPIENPYQIVQDIRQTCLDGIQERIPNIEIQVYELNPEQGVIVIFIPSSEKRPHMVSRDHRTEFYCRYGTDKRSMTVGEIRDTFLTNPFYRRIVELEFQAKGYLDSRKEESEYIPSYIQVLTERTVERFMQRYLIGSTEAQSIVIVSPYIADLAEEMYSLEKMLNKAQKEKSLVYVITQEPGDDYHRTGLAVLDQKPFVEIRYNHDIHAKLYICWGRKEAESFALFGSGNLTPSGMRHNIELGMMILSRGYGRTLVRDLYYWGAHSLRVTSRRVKAINPLGE